MLVTLVINNHHSRAISRMLLYLEISLATFRASDSTTDWAQLNFNPAANLNFFHMPLDVTSLY